LAGGDFRRFGFRWDWQQTFLDGARLALVLRAAGKCGSVGLSAEFFVGWFYEDLRFVA
jgi:hypothetical protein